MPRVIVADHAAVFTTQMLNDGLLPTLAVLAQANFPHTQRLVGRALHNVSCSNSSIAEDFSSLPRSMSRGSLRPGRGVRQRVPAACLLDIVRVVDRD
jgi:hypothetical protein